MIGTYLFQNPKVAAALILAMVLPSAWFITDIEHSSLRIFESDDRAARSALEAVGHRFVPDDMLIIAYETDDIFDPGSLARDRALRQTLESMILTLSDGSTTAMALDVLSLTNAKDAFGTNAAFSMHPLVEDPIATDPAAIAETRRRGHANPLIAANLISRDDRVAAIIVRVNPYLTDEGLFRLVERIREEMEKVQAATGVPYYLMGHAVTEVDFQTFAVHDLVRYTPVTAVIALALCFAFTLSWWSVFALGTIILAAQTVALGMMPIFGFKFNPLSVGISPASIILAGSTLIHFVGEAGNSLYGAHQSWEEARVQIFREVIRPAFLCCLFTAIGFFSVYVSAVEAIREFGMAAAVVTATSFVITVLGVALWWCWWPVELFVRRGSPAVSSGFQDALSRFCGLVVRHPVITLVGTLAVLAAGAAGISRLEINENALEYYPESSPVRIANDFIEERLAGTEMLAVVIERPEQDFFLDPAELRKLDGFVEELRAESWTDSVVSIVEYVKLMRQAVYGEAEAEYRIPDTQKQIGLLLAISGEERIHEYLDQEKRAVRISIRSKIHDTKTLSAISLRLEERLAELYPSSAGYHASVVGISRVFAATTDLIARAEVESLSLTCVVIVTLIMILFRSTTVGLLSILPNAVPVLFVLGFMGWIGKPITVGNSMICGIAFGVAVEDTIHLIEGYRERLRMQETIENAVDYAFRVKAPAGIWTSIMLACGFMAIGLASFHPVSDFGVLLSIAVTTSLIGNLLILPSTILLFRCRCGVKERELATPEAPLSMAGPHPTTLR